MLITGCFSDWETGSLPTIRILTVSSDLLSGRTQEAQGGVTKGVLHY